MNTDEIEKVIVDLSSDPFNAEKNFSAAIEYEKLNQTGSAVSFYLRAAEFGAEQNVPLIVYTSLIKLAHCFESQNDRVNAVSNALLQAVAWDPSRPEALFLLAQFYERQHSWQESYTWAEMGTKLESSLSSKLPLDVGYVEYGFLFEKSVVTWYLGRKDECIDLITQLRTMDLSPEYRASVESNWEMVTNGSV